MIEAAASDPLGLIGTLLDGKYRIDARIAEGGFGVVYAGRHIGLARPLAIKVLKRVPAPNTAWADMVGHFLEEARLVARLRHPAVVTVLDAGVTRADERSDGLPWIVMEWLEGETLAHDLARRLAQGEAGRTRAETFELLRPIVEAIAEAHEAGIVHRDVNPNNIMLVPGPAARSARILDFGIAKVMRPDAGVPGVTTTTREGVQAFSVAYAAPEQLAGTRTGPWTDVYALGLVVTELLCGRSIRASDVHVHYRAAFDPTRPTPAARGVDAGAWEAVLARALALAPSDRHGSAGELLIALDDALLAERATAPAGPGDRSSATPMSVPARVRGYLQRRAHPRLVIGAGVGVTLLFAASWVALRSDRGAPAAIPCTSNAACSRPDVPAVCRPGAGCVALRSQDCEPLADARALASDATVWFGTMFPRTGPDAAVFGQRNTNAVDLARRDFAQIMSGASAAKTLESGRPFGLVVCDDNAAPHRAANHLADIGVPAVIGFYKSVEAIDLIASVLLPRRILAISSLNTNPLVTRVPHPRGVPRLVWRTTYSSADAATALSAWIDGALEPALRRDRELPHGPMRVALLRPRDAAGAALSDAFSATLRFNGTTALANGTNYREMTFLAEAPQTSPAYPDIARVLLAFAPLVVLYAGNIAIIDAVFAPLEQHWPASAPHRPRYASVATLPDKLLQFIGTSRDRRRRFFGITPVSEIVSNARFVTHYNEAFADKVTRTINPNSSYDAFYLLAYATYAIPTTEAVSGERLSHAFDKLMAPGRPIEVGIAGIFDAYATLSHGAAIDLTGATGALDFERATGEAPFDLAILCAGSDDRGMASSGIESGLVYRAASRQLAGTMRCP